MTVKRGAGVRLTLVSIAVPYAEPHAAMPHAVCAAWPTLPGGPV